MKRILLLIAVSCIGAVAAQAQEVMPVFVGGQDQSKPMKGQFTNREQIIAGDARDRGAAPIAMVNGQPKFGALDASTQVELKDTSAVIPPKRFTHLRLPGAMRERLHGHVLEAAWSLARPAKACN